MTFVLDNSNTIRDFVGSRRSLPSRVKSLYSGRSHLRSGCQINSTQITSPCSCVPSSWDAACFCSRSSQTAMGTRQSCWNSDSIRTRCADANRKPTSCTASCEDLMILGNARVPFNPLKSFLWFESQISMMYLPAVIEIPEQLAAAYMLA